MPEKVANVTPCNMYYGNDFQSFYYYAYLPKRSVKEKREAEKEVIIFRCNARHQNIYPHTKQQSYIFSIQVMCQKILLFFYMKRYLNVCLLPVPLININCTRHIVSPDVNMPTVGPYCLSVTRYDEL